MGEMKNNAFLVKQAPILSQKLRRNKQNCFLTNIDPILKNYDINHFIK